MEENIQTSVESIPTTPIELTPPIDKKLKTNWRASFAFLILGVLIGVGGLLGYQNYLASLKPMAKIGSSPAPTVDPTTNWKTYTNTKYNFRFKYPSTWVVKENSIAETTSKITDDKKAHQIEILDENGKNMALISPELPITYGTPFTKNDVVVAGKNVTVYTYGSGPTKHFANFQIVGFPNFVIDLYYANDKNLNQILSTFQFLESSSGPTSTSKACTQEAKLCPDGSYVGRTGPNCEFTPCP